MTRARGITEQAADAAIYNRLPGPAPAGHPRPVR